MNKIYIYLAGPITGCSNGEANDWRDYMRKELALRNPAFVGVSPLRCEPIHGELYLPNYEDNQFGNPQVIAAKNKMDVRRCDLTLAYMPARTVELVGGGAAVMPPSIGTLQEIGWAAGMGKPIILVSDDDYVIGNAVIEGTVPWRFGNTNDGLERAIEVIEGLYGVYA